MISTGLMLCKITALVLIFVSHNLMKGLYYFSFNLQLFTLVSLLLQIFINYDKIFGELDEGRLFSFIMIKFSSRLSFICSGNCVFLD